MAAQLRRYRAALFSAWHIEGPSSKARSSDELADMPAAQQGGDLLAGGEREQRSTAGGLLLVHLMSGMAGQTWVVDLHPLAGSDPICSPRLTGSTACPILEQSRCRKSPRTMSLWLKLQEHRACCSS